tara:strand:+ start:283 stop:600 length:318 start_codon:yes stop_codon:yes gene_type:complete
MKQTVTESIFRDTMRRLRPNNFTWGNLSHLYNYFVELEEASQNYLDDCGTEVEFDPIAICCEYSEYKNLAEFQEAYSGDFEDREDIEVMTTFIEGDDDSFIILDF